MVTQKISSLSAGCQFFLRGIQLIAEPDLRIFVIVPFFINLIIFSAFSYWAIGQFSGLLAFMMGYLPDWDWLATVVQWILSILFGLILLLTMGYTFTLVANLVAAPFNGILAEKVEIKLTGKAPPSETLISMTFRTIGRELRKWMYFLPRSFGLLILGGILLLIPGLNLIVPLISFLWGAWCMAIQYVDYPVDNHQLDFAVLKKRVGTHKYTSLGFGGVIILASSVPIVNFFVMPVAVAGATALAIENRMCEPAE